jgi:hypothetical protein
MVTTAETGQLAGECTLWIDTLRSFRNKFQHHKVMLLQLAADQTQKDMLLEIEHFDNQFHIQLINIHDLKQSIKKHMNKIAFEKTFNNGHYSDDILARQEYLYDEFQRLDTTLHIISREFDRFAKYLGVK